MYFISSEIVALKLKARNVERKMEASWDASKPERDMKINWFKQLALFYLFVSTSIYTYITFNVKLGMSGEPKKMDYTFLEVLQAHYINYKLR